MIPFYSCWRRFTYFDLLLIAYWIWIMKHIFFCLFEMILLVGFFPDNFHKHTKWITKFHIHSENLVEFVLYGQRPQILCTYGPTLSQNVLISSSSSLISCSTAKFTSICTYVYPNKWFCYSWQWYKLVSIMYCTVRHSTTAWKTKQTIWTFDLFLCFFWLLLHCFRCRLRSDKQ